MKEVYFCRTYLFVQICKHLGNWDFICINILRNFRQDTQSQLVPSTFPFHIKSYLGVPLIIFVTITQRCNLIKIVFMWQSLKLVVKNNLIILFLWNPFSYINSKHTRQTLYFYLQNILFQGHWNLSWFPLTLKFHINAYPGMTPVTLLPFKIEHIDY